MNEKDEQLRTDLMEAILAYFEGLRTFRSVLTLGITANGWSRPVRNQNIAEVVSQLNSMGNEIGNGKSFSREDIKDIFTTMLEKLTKD